MVGLVLTLTTFLWTAVLLFAGTHIATYLGSFFV
jgi:hypothetical protein